VPPYGAVPPPSIEAALEGLAAEGELTAFIETSEDPAHPIRCTLDPARSPRGVALFAGLARGRAAWRDPRAAAIVQGRRYYDGLLVFRAIPNLMIQSGCPAGDGTGHPGFRIEVESHPDDAVRLAKPGALLLAAYHPAPNREDPTPPPPGQVIGSQFVITLGDMKHLASKVTVIGACRERDLEHVSRIAEAVASAAHAVTITRVGIEVTPRDPEADAGRRD